MDLVTSLPVIGPVTGLPAHWAEAVVVPPPCEPVSLAQVKQRLRIAQTADDADLQLLLAAARRQVETDTSAVLVSATLTLTLDAPVPTVFSLSRWPVQHVTAIRVVASDGTLTPLDPTTYGFDGASRPPRISLVSGGAWPTTITIGALQIEFVAGFARTPVAVTSLDWASGVATIVAPAHGFLAGDAVTLRGATDEFYNGTFPVLSTTDADTLTAALPLQPGWPAPSSPATGTLLAIDLGTAPTLQLAVLALVGHWWDALRRGLTTTHSVGGELPLPFGYETLISDRVEWVP